MGEDDEDEEQPECDRRDDEEVSGHDLARVIGEKGAPGLRRRPSLSLHVLGDGGLTHRDSQFAEFAVNPGCTPQRVRRGHLTNQRADVVRHWRAASALTALPRPVLATAVKLTVVAGENLTVGSTIWLPAEGMAPGR